MIAPRNMTRARRARIMEAHGNECAGCGEVRNPETFEIDHEMPLWLGGSDEDQNMKPRCLSCHRIKTAGESAQRAKIERIREKRFDPRSKKQRQLDKFKARRREGLVAERQE